MCILFTPVSQYNTRDFPFLLSYSYTVWIEWVKGLEGFSFRVGQGGERLLVSFEGGGGGDNGDDSQARSS